MIETKVYLQTRAAVMLMYHRPAHWDAATTPDTGRPRWLFQVVCLAVQAAGMSSSRLLAWRLGWFPGQIGEACNSGCRVDTNPQTAWFLLFKRGSDDPIFILEAMFGDHDPYTTKASPTYVYVRQTAQVAASISMIKSIQNMPWLTSCAVA